MFDFSGPRQKLARAKHHLDALNAEVDAFCDSQSYTFFVDAYPDTVKCVLYAKINHATPEHWSCVVGDFCHNARGALELLIPALGGTAVANSHFPIVEHVNMYAGAEKAHLGGLSALDVALVESVQPYNRTAGHEGDSLFILRQINNLDKHRLIVVVAAAGRLLMTHIMLPAKFSNSTIPGSPDECGLSYSNDGALRIDDWIIKGTPTNMTINGAAVAEFEIWGELDVKMKPECSCEVQFGPTCKGIEGRPVVDTLTFIFDRVEEIIGKAEANHAV